VNSSGLPILSFNAYSMLFIYHKYEKISNRNEMMGAGNLLHRHGFQDENQCQG
jgi:hypothetical protein